MFAQNTLSLAIWLPILGAVLVLAIGSDRNAAIARWLSLAVAVATFIATIPLYTQFNTHTHAMQFVKT